MDIVHMKNKCPKSSLQGLHLQKRIAKSSLVGEIDLAFFLLLITHHGIKMPYSNFLKKKVSCREGIDNNANKYKRLSYKNMIFIHKKNHSIKRK